MSCSMVTRSQLGESFLSFHSKLLNSFASPWSASHQVVLPSRAAPRTGSHLRRGEEKRVARKYLNIAFIHQNPGDGITEEYVFRGLVVGCVEADLSKCIRIYFCRWGIFGTPKQTKIKIQDLQDLRIFASLQTRRLQLFVQIEYQNLNGLHRFVLKN